LHARNTLEQLLALYTNSESQNAQRHRQTDRQTDRQQDDANSRSYCVAVRSAKNVEDCKRVNRYFASQLFLFVGAKTNFGHLLTLPCISWNENC